MTLPEMFRAEREAMGFTLAQAADAIGISKTWLSTFETGKTELRVSVLQRYARLLSWQLKFTVVLPDEHP